MEEEQDQFKLAESILSGKALDKLKQVDEDENFFDSFTEDDENEYYEEQQDQPLTQSDFNEAERILKGEDQFSVAEQLLNPDTKQHKSKILEALLIVPGSSVFNDLYILGQI